MKSLSKRTMKELVSRLLLAMVCLSAVFLSIGATGASAEEPKGWVEVKTTVPEGFSNDYLVLQAINMDTGYAPDFQILQINDYILRTQVPTGDYMIDAVFVNQDFRYKVTPASREFTVKEGVAAPIALTVELLDQYKPQEEEPVEEDPVDPEQFADAEVEPAPAPEEPTPEAPSEEPSDVPEGSEPPASSSDPSAEPSADPSAEPSDVPEDEKDGEKTDAEKRLSKALVSLAGTALFCGTVFLVVYLVRSKMEND